MKPIDTAWKLLKEDIPDEWFNSRIGREIKQLMDKYGLTYEEALEMYKYGK